MRKGYQKLSSPERKRIRRFRDEAIRRQKNRCYYCKELMLHPSALSVYRASAEHLIKVSEGGGANEWNIVAAHQQCQEDFN